MRSKWIIFLLAAATIDANFLYGTSVKHQLDSKTWPHTPGVITQSRLYNSTRLGSQAVLAYTYRVNGQDCYSRRYKFLGNQLPADTIARYPLGKPVKVFYNPADPLMAVLAPGLTNSDFDNAIFFFCLNALPAAGIWFIVSKSKPARIHPATGPSRK